MAPEIITPDEAETQSSYQDNPDKYLAKLAAKNAFAGWIEFFARRALQKRFTLPEKIMILDAGCGPGKMLEIIVGNLGESADRMEFVGADFTPAFVELARKAVRPGTQKKLYQEVFERNLKLLNYPEPIGVFDAALCLYHTIGHIREGRQQVIEQLHSALVPGGLLVIDCCAKGVAEIAHVGAYYSRVAANEIRYEGRNMQLFGEHGFFDELIDPKLFEVISKKAVVFNLKEETQRFVKLGQEKPSGIPVAYFAAAIKK